jgi:outer membrane protein assembly factor BamB
MTLMAGWLVMTLAVVAPVWTQFRLGPQSNAVVPGTLQTTWRIETGAQISASPTVIDGTLYIGNNGGMLYAIDAAKGQTLWKVRVSNPLMSAPLIYGDLIIVGEGDATSVSAADSRFMTKGEGPSALIAFNRFDGTLRWQTGLTGSAMPTPAVIDGLLVDHDGAGWITVLDPATGDVRYKRFVSSIASMSAVVPIGDGDFLTAGAGSNAAWRFHADDGTVVWRRLFSNAVSAIDDCPQVHDDRRVYCDYVAPVAPDTLTVIGHPALQRAYALDANTGAPLWDLALETGVLPERNEAAIPLLADGLLYIGSAVGPWMHAVDAETGMLLWEMPTHGAVKGGIVEVDGVIYFGDGGGYLWALDAKTGHVVGDKFMHTRFNVGSPIVDGETLIIGSDSGAVIAIPLSTIRASHDS